MSVLKEQFDKAVEYVQTAEGDFKPSNDVKLQFYALYKQATEGDVKGKKPGMLDQVGRAKYSAWEKLKGTSSEDAMQQYVDLLESMKKTRVDPGIQSRHPMRSRAFSSIGRAADARLLSSSASARSM